MTGGNVLRAVRETGVPQQTVRNWKRKWARDGPPEAMIEVAEAQVIPDFVETATRVRNKALGQIELLLPNTDVKDLAKLATIVGIMDDKVRLALGLATSRKEVNHSLPSAEAMRELGKSFAVGAVAVAHERDAAIIDVVPEEQAPRALLSPLHD